MIMDFLRKEIRGKTREKKKRSTLTRKAASREP
jgi:hypothetical protein